MTVPILFSFRQQAEIGAAMVNLNGKKSQTMTVPILFNFRQLAEIGAAMVNLNGKKP